MTEMIDSAAENVLSSKRLILRHPGSRSISEFYPSPSSSSTQLAECVNARGRYQIDSDQRNFGGSATFQFSSSSIVQNFHLNMAVTCAANRVMQAGWGLKCIRELQISFSNSLMQSVTISGEAYTEFLIAMCESGEMREYLLDQCGKATLPAGGVSQASVPIMGNLFANAMGQKSGFPLDASTLSGSISFVVIFHEAGAFTVNTAANAAAVPTQFDSLKLSCDTTDLLTSAFSVRQSLAYNPEMSYNIPSKYLNSVSLPSNVNIVPGVVHTMQLNSVPSGMLNCIVLSIKPTAEITGVASAAGANAIYNPMLGSVNLSTLRLSYSGTDIFNARNPAQLEALYRSCFGGDTLRYYQTAHGTTPAAGIVGPVDATYDRFRSQCHVIPLTYDGCNALRGKLVENLSSYSGSSLQLEFTVDPVQSRTKFVAAAPWADTNQVLNQVPLTPLPYTITVCYVMSSIFEVSQGSADLQL
jgi:hypothetical protein